MSCIRQQGFSLLETLVAVMIVAIALDAILEGLGTIVKTHTALKIQALAQQVAWQQFVFVRSGLETDQVKTVEQCQQSWRVVTTFTDTGFPNTHQVSITVQPSEILEGRKVLLSGLVIR